MRDFVMRLRFDLFGFRFIGLLTPIRYADPLCLTMPNPVEMYGGAKARRVYGNLISRCVRVLYGRAVVSSLDPWLFTCRVHLKGDLKRNFPVPHPREGSIKVQTP